MHLLLAFAAGWFARALVRRRKSDAVRVVHLPARGYRIRDAFEQHYREN